MNLNFLQSPEWRKFQEAVGRKTYNISDVNIIEHQLPVVGKYFYVPKGPVMEISNSPNCLISNKIPNSKFKIISELIDLARKNKIGWVRIDPENEEILNAIKNNINYKVQKAPHDMQPRQILVIDITKSEDELLAGMKAKTRYNIRLSQKHNVSVRVISNSPNCLISNKIPNSKSQIPNKLQIQNSNDQNFYANEFLRLTKIMAKRQGITAHPDGYYRKMFETIPGEILKLYVAEYEGPASTRGDDRSSTRGGEIIAANIVVFYQDVCTYLHGASDDKYKNLMAPYLLQWQGILDAKKAGCKMYDLGGVKTLPHPNPLLLKEREQKPSPLQGEGAPLRRSLNEASHRADEVNSWAGITRFKLGFSPETAPVEFPGSYDIVINSWKYKIYLALGKMRSWIKIF